MSDLIGRYIERETRARAEEEERKRREEEERKRQEAAARRARELEALRQWRASNAGDPAPGGSPSSQTQTQAPVAAPDPGLSITASALQGNQLPGIQASQGMGGQTVQTEEPRPRPEPRQYGTPAQVDVQGPDVLGRMLESWRPGRTIGNQDPTGARGPAGGAASMGQDVLGQVDPQQPGPWRDGYRAQELPGLVGAPEERPDPEGPGLLDGQRGWRMGGLLGYVMGEEAPADNALSRYGEYLRSTPQHEQLQQLAGWWGQQPGRMMETAEQAWQGENPLGGVWDWYRNQPGHRYSTEYLTNTLPEQMGVTFDEYQEALPQVTEALPSMGLAGRIARPIVEYLSQNPETMRNAQSAVESLVIGPQKTVVTTPIDELAQVLLTGQAPAGRGDLPSLVQLVQPIGEVINRTLIGGPFDRYIAGGQWGVDQITNWGDAQAEMTRLYEESRALDEYIAGLPEEQRREADMFRVIYGSGPAAVRAGVEQWLGRDAEIAQLNGQAGDALASGDVVEAARLGAQIHKLQNVGLRDVIDENANVWAELAEGFLVPDPVFDTAGAVMGVLGLSKNARLLSRLERLQMSGLSPAAAQRQALHNIEQAMEGARPFIEAIEGGQVPRLATWLDDAVPWRAQADSRAQESYRELYNGTVVILEGLADAGDIKRVLMQLATDPKVLVEGGLENIGGLAREVWSPGVVGNELFAEHLPVLRAAAGQIAEMESLAKAGNVNKQEVMAEFGQIAYDAARQFHQPRSRPLPFGAESVRLRNMEGDQAIVEYMKGDKVVRTSDTVRIDEARRMVREMERAATGGARNAGDVAFDVVSFPSRVVKDWMNLNYLGLRPENWVRNALGAATMMFATDSVTFLRMSDLTDDLAVKFGGAMPTGRLFTADTGREITQAARGAAGEVQAKAGLLDSALSRTLGENNLISRFLRGAYDIPYGAKGITIPVLNREIPIGEQNWYTRIWYKGFERTFRWAWDEAITQDLARRLPAELAPELSRTILDTVFSAGVNGSERDVLRAVREAVNGQYTRMTLRGLGAPDELLPKNVAREVERAMNHGPDVSPAEAEARVHDQFNRARSWAAEMLFVKEPEPGHAKWMDMDAAQAMGEIADDMAEAGRRAGLDPATVREQSVAVATRRAEAFETGVGRLVSDLVGMENRPDAWAVVQDMFREMMTLQGRAYTETDKAAAQAIRMQNQQGWLHKWEVSNRVWGRYADEVDQTIEKYRGLLAQVDQGGSYRSTLDWDEILTRYMEWDEAEFARVRAQAKTLGQANLDNEERFQAAIQANRQFLHNSFVELFDAFRMYPSMENLSLLTESWKRSSRQGAKAAAYMGQQRDLLFEKKMANDAYYAIRNKVWPEMFDESAKYNRAMVRVIIANGLAEEAETGLRWVDDFAGGEFRLLYPKDDKRWVAVRLDDNTLHEFADPSASSGESKVPARVVEDYRQALGLNGEAVETLAARLQTEATRGGNALSQGLADGVAARRAEVTGQAAADVPGADVGPGPAMWRTDETDQPVVITGTLGEQDGVRYYSIEGSSTGIPETELLPANPMRPAPTAVGEGDLIRRQQSLEALTKWELIDAYQDQLPPLDEVPGGSYANLTKRQLVDLVNRAQARGAPAPSPTPATRPTFGQAVDPQAGPGQANMFGETAEDLPLMSGQAYGPRETGTFAPTEQAGRQESMLDVRPRMGAEEPSYTPTIAPETGPNPNALRGAASQAGIGTATEAGKATDAHLLNFINQTLDLDVRRLDELRPNERTRALEALELRAQRRAESRPVPQAEAVAPRAVAAPAISPDADVAFQADARRTRSVLQGMTRKQIVETFGAELQELAQGSISKLSKRELVDLLAIDAAPEMAVEAGPNAVRFLSPQEIDQADATVESLRQVRREMEETWWRATGEQPGGRAESSQGLGLRDLTRRLREGGELREWGRGADGRLGAGRLAEEGRLDELATFLIGPEARGDAVVDWLWGFIRVEDELAAAQADLRQGPERFARLSAREVVIKAREEETISPAMAEWLADLVASRKMKRDEVLRWIEAAEGFEADGPGMQYYQGGLFGVALDWRELWRAVRRNRAAGGQSAMDVGDVARATIDNLDDLERAVLDAMRAPRQPNQINNALRTQTIDAAEAFVRQVWGRALRTASRGGEDLADFAMLDYGRRTNLDAWAALAMPYHYFWSRMATRFAQMPFVNPQFLAHWYRLERAIDLENEQAGVPARLEGTLPHPTDPERRLWNPLAYAIPFSAYTNANPFVRPEDANNDFERYYTRARQWVPGLFPHIEASVDAIQDMRAPLEDGKRRTDKYTLGNLMPMGRILYYLNVARTGEVGPNRGFWNLGDGADGFRAARVVPQVALEEEMSPELARYAQQILLNQQAGRPPGENVPEEMFEEANALAQRSTSQAARDRLEAIGLGFATGVRQYPFRAEEQALMAAGQAYNDAAYSEDNPFGSRAAMQGELDNAPMLRAWWSRNRLLPGAEGIEPGQAAQRDEFYAKRAAIYDEMNAAVDAFLAENPNASRDQVSAIKQPYYDRANALGEAPASGGGSGEQPRGMRPEEAAVWRIENILQQETPDKPAYFDEDATPEEKQSYYTAKAEWDMAEQERVRRELQGLVEELAQSQDPDAPAVVAEVERLLAGRYASDVIRQYSNRHAGDREFAWAEEQALAQEMRSAEIQGRQQQAVGNVRRVLGPEAAARFEEYRAADEETRAAMRAADWRYGQMQMAAYNPEEYREAVDLFGPDFYRIYNARPRYPEVPEGEEASEGQLQAYYDALDAYSAANPNYPAINLWMTGRNQATREVRDMLTDGRGFYRYDYGEDYAEAMSFLPADVFAWELAYGAERDISKERGNAWIRANEPKWEALKALWAWRSEHSEREFVTDLWVPGPGEVEPGPEPGMPIDLANYNGPRPFGSDAQPILGGPSTEAAGPFGPDWIRGGVLGGGDAIARSAASGAQMQVDAKRESVVRTPSTRFDPGQRQSGMISIQANGEWFEAPLVPDEEKAYLLQELVGRQFTPEALAYLTENVTISVGDFGPEAADNGGGWFYVAGNHVHLMSMQQEAAIHELAHAWWETERDENADGLVAALLRLAEDEGARAQYPAAWRLAQDYVHGTADWPGMGSADQEGLHEVAANGRYWNDHEIYAGLASGVMGDINQLPPYLRTFYEPLLQPGLPGMGQEPDLIGRMLQQSQQGAGGTGMAGPGMAGPMQPQPGQQPGLGDLAGAFPSLAAPAAGEAGRPGYVSPDPARMRAYAMTDEGFARSQAWGQEQATRRAWVVNAWGEDVAQQWDQYFSLESGSPEREAMRYANPALRAAILTAYNPQAWRVAQDEGFSAEDAMGWAGAPRWMEDGSADEARREYWRANPRAWLFSQYLNGRPGSMDDGDQAEEWSYNWGEDYREAISRFGDNIWALVLEQRSLPADPATRARWYEANPSWGRWSDWWYGNLPDRDRSAVRQGYWYGGGWGGGGWSSWEDEDLGRAATVYADRYDDRVGQSVRPQPWRAERFNRDWMYAGREIGPEQLRSLQRWYAPRDGRM